MKFQGILPILLSHLIKIVIYADVHTFYIHTHTIHIHTHTVAIIDVLPEEFLV